MFEKKKSVFSRICNYARTHFLKFFALYFFNKFLKYILFANLTETAHELVYAASGVYELALTSVERVRGA